WETIAFQARHLSWYHHAKTLDALRCFSKLAMPMVDMSFAQAATDVLANSN
ncbi:hypothetical protein CLV74_1351, partial [Donghicola tyrosinivorans]